MFFFIFWGLLYIVSVSLYSQVLPPAASAMRSRAWLPQFERKEEKEQKIGRKMENYLKRTKVETKRKCLAQFFVDVVCMFLRPSLM